MTDFTVERIFDFLRFDRPYFFDLEALTGFTPYP